MQEMLESRDGPRTKVIRVTRTCRYGDWPIVRGLIRFGGRALDLGGGDGELMRSFNAVLVDTNRELLRKASPKSKIVGDMHNLPFTKNRFSCVVLNHVLEHSPNPSRVLYECRRVCVDDAQLVINVPNSNSLVDIMLSLVGKKTALNASEHFQHFSRSSIFMLLVNNKFNHIRFHATFLNFTKKIGLNTTLPVLREIGKNIIVTVEVHKDRKLDG
jgi:ubiquinone/menaquinone biosynthesis C-methylase UbiE